MSLGLGALGRGAIGAGIFASGSADITVALSGSALTSAQGSFTVVATVGVSGSQFAGATGSLSVDGSVTVVLSGVVLTATPGEITTIANDGVVLTLSGVSATFAQGAVSTALFTRSGNVVIVPEA